MLTIAEPRHENCEDGTKRALATRLQCAQHVEGIGVGVELEISVEQAGAQPPVDRRKPLEAIIQRPLGQRPEFDVATGQRMGPGVFDLFLPP